MLMYSAKQSTNVCLVVDYILNSRLDQQVLIHFHFSMIFVLL
jgi:hypothetical protein